MSDSPNKLGELFTRCWTDDAFKARFLKDPKAVLAEAGLKTANVDVEVVENTATKMYITLPAKPLEAGELSDAQLEGASGGAGPYVAAGTQPTIGKAKPVDTKRVTTQNAPASSTYIPPGYCYASPC